MLTIAEDVRSALKAGEPVVALESTIVTHGMPWPRNLEVAQQVEACVREEGAVPATIAVLGGDLTIGLDGERLERLARSENVRKLSSADLAHAMVRGDDGSTTVAATMAAMRAADIRVFATGGIGGVHRGAESDFDISADLDALAHERQIVVCAGPKAILDVTLTLEALETRGVPVVAMGTDILPTFWSRDGKHEAPLRLDGPSRIAAMARQRDALDQTGAILVAVPVPETDAIPSAQIGSAIETALAEAERGGVKGKAVTPFLLSRMLELTGGRSLQTNAALIRNNARVAARIASELCR